MAMKVQATVILPGIAAQVKNLSQKRVLHGKQQAEEPVWSRTMFC